MKYGYNTSLSDFGSSRVLQQGSQYGCLATGTYLTHIEINPEHEDAFTEHQAVRLSPETTELHF